MGIGFSTHREQMVQNHLMGRDIADRLVLDAMLRVERHRFVDEALYPRAYNDCALPIGSGQTISQPYIVALMLQQLNLSESTKILEIGTGSGYQTAILAEICDSVFSIERLAPLASKARKTLDELGYTNIAIRVSDGGLGWKEYAPFDAIIISAASDGIPETLLDQLAPEGKLIVPIGGKHGQKLTIFNRSDDKFNKQSICNCIFVPLIREKTI